MEELDLFSESPARVPAKEIEPWTVSALTDEIKRTLERALGEVRVAGEISNVRRQSSGHLYFTLKDAEAQLQGVMFRSDADAVGFQVDNGMEVVASGSLTVYKPRGNYQIRVRHLKPRGVGSLQARFEVLKNKLSSEGLFDPSRKKKLPVFPKTIGLITSPTGAVLQDFMQVLGRRCPHLSVVLGGVRVQGAQAADEVVAMIETFNHLEGLDVVVIARGGGSLEDLWTFNEEAVVRAVAASSLPVISAIGHETDFTLTDFAADLRAPTPSAAAEVVAVPREEWMKHLETLSRRLNRTLLHEVTQRRGRWRELSGHYVFREPARAVEGHMQRLDECRERMGLAAQRAWRRHQERWLRVQSAWFRIGPDQTLKLRRERLNHFGRQLTALSPQGVLERGYALVFNSRGSLIRGLNDADIGEPLKIKLSESTFSVEVHEKTAGGLRQN